MGTVKSIRNIGLAAMGLIIMIFMMASVSFASNDPIRYLDENEEEQTVTDYTLVKDMSDKKGTSMYGGSAPNYESWYVLTESRAFEYRINAYGTVNLILCDNATLTLEKGIHVPSNSSIRIYGQSTETDMGKIYANCKEYSRDAALGGNEDETNGDIIINGGEVTVRSGKYASGIGGGDEGHTGNITINGGKVDAEGGYEGAGIGGGDKGGGGNIIINGGYVEATGGESASGIGAGDEANGGNVTINGGTVKAYSGHYSYGNWGSKYTGAGIGGGRFGNAGEITINGGRVVAIGKHGSAGIGNGSGNNLDHDGIEYGGNCKGGRITITGGDVTGDGNFNRQNENGQLDDGGAGIGSGYQSYGVEVIITGGNVTAYGSYHASEYETTDHGYSSWTVGKEPSACVGNGYDSRSKGIVTITGDENSKTQILATRPYAYPANGVRMVAIGASAGSENCDVSINYPGARVERLDENNNYQPVTMGENTLLNLIKDTVMMKLCYCEHDPSSYEADQDGHIIRCQYCKHTSGKIAHPYDGYFKDETDHWQQCTVCGFVTEKEAHTYVDGVCKCGAVETNPISAVTHTVTFDADNGTSANQTATIFDNGIIRKPDQVPEKPGYVFLGWKKVVKDAAGNNTLEDDYYDFGNGVTENFTLQAIWEHGDHSSESGNLVEHESKSPTCTEDGNAKYWQCKVCKKCFADNNGTRPVGDSSFSIPKKHNMQWASINETQHQYQCTNCDYREDPEDHFWDEGTITKIPTDTQAGEITFKCVYCGYEKTEEVQKNAPPIYHVITSVEGEGIAVATPEKGTSGTEVSLNAVPADGYEFAGWIINGGDCADTDKTAESTTLTIELSDVSAKALFNKTETKPDDQGGAAPTQKVSLDNAKVTLASEPLVYSGEALKPEIKAIAGLTLQEGTDYTVSFANEAGAINAPVDAGDYTMTIAGMGKYSGTATVSFTIAKAGNSLIVKGKTIKPKTKKSAKVKIVKKTKKYGVKKAFKISGAQGDLNFKKVNKAGKKKIKVNPKTGKITVKKGLKKGKYKVKVLVTASGDANHEAASVKTVVKIKVK